MLPKQNWDGKLTFLLLALNLYKCLFGLQINNYCNYCNANSNKILSCFIKINIDYFSGSPKLPLIPKVSISLKIKKKTFLRYVSMKWWTIINPKCYIISSNVIIKTPWAFSIKFYSIAAIHIPLFIMIFFNISNTKQTIF